MLLIRKGKYLQPYRNDRLFKFPAINVSVDIVDRFKDSYGTLLSNQTEMLRSVELFGIEKF